MVNNVKKNNYLKNEFFTLFWKNTSKCQISYFPRNFVVVVAIEKNASYFVSAVSQKFYGKILKYVAVFLLVHVNRYEVWLLIFKI